MAPVGGYSSTYKFFLGGATFFKFEDFSWNNLLLATTSKSFRLEEKLSWEIQEGVQWVEPELRVDFGFEPYYGIGGLTAISDRVLQDGRQFEGRFTLRRRGDTAHEVGLGYHFFHWKPFRIQNSETQEILRENNYHGVFLFFRVGQLDSQKQRKEGTRLLTELKSEIFPARSYQVEGSQVVEFFFPYFSLSNHARLGTEWNLQRDYFLYFSSGGTDVLRGFEKNRFVGDTLFLYQLELKSTYLFSGLRAVLFTDLGTTYLRSEPPRGEVSYGVGLRYDLPPDETEIIRVDVGWSRDDFGIYFDFGKTF